MHVAGGVEEHALRLGAVASGAARLLVVVLQAAREIVVGDVAHVRFVDAHAEGVRGHHDPRAVVEEVVLVALPLAGGKSGVVPRGKKPMGAQVVADLLDGATARAVDDAAAVLARLAEAQQPAVLVGAALRALDGEGKVRSVETRHHAEGVGEPERCGDVLADPAGRRRGERHNRRTRRERPDKLNNPLVRRPEVVSPLADAVRLVNREKRHAAGRCRPKEALVVEPLGRHVDERERAGRDAKKDALLLVGAKRGVEAARRDAALDEHAYLVCHERYQGRNHNGQPARGLRHCYGRHLVAD